MATYVAAHISKLEYSTNGSSWTDVNLFDATKIKMEETPVKQTIQEGKSVTAKKKAVVEATLFDFAIKAGLAGIESAFTPCQWRLTLKSGNTIKSAIAPISITQTNAPVDGLLGYVVSSEYEVPIGTDAFTYTLS